MLQTANDAPNFTIVLPVDCQADCVFCSWRTSNQDKQKMDDDKFFKAIIHTLNNLPSNCTELTISGGEPTTYPYLEQVLKLIQLHKKENIKKVVFTTNGQNLYSWAKDSLFLDVVDYVNISRHHYIQEDNDRIMRIRTINWNTICSVSDRLSKAGIRTNINCILSTSVMKEYDYEFLACFIDYARNHSINSITFRKDYDDGFGMHYLEQEIQETYKPLHIGECPVCRKSKYLINGMEVLFTTSEFEPTAYYGSQSIYEFILQPNGNLTSDWEGNSTVELDTKPKLKQCTDNTSNLNLTSRGYLAGSGRGCGSSGCR
jgi:MoaA/NifB/PqqE/SkfB family radical SAM enzyme